MLNQSGDNPVSEEGREEERMDSRTLLYTAVSRYRTLSTDKSGLVSRVKSLQKQIDAVDIQLSGLFIPESLLVDRGLDGNRVLSAKAVKLLNHVLLSALVIITTPTAIFPLSFASVEVDGDHLTLNLIFSQPLFSGWKGVRCWQFCPLSTETPVEKPFEDAVAQYVSSGDFGFKLTFWDYVGTELTLWGESKDKRLTFVLSDTVENLISKVKEVKQKKLL